VHMGVDISDANGFIRNRGLRILGGGRTLELPWPELATYPDFGLVRPRKDFDELLARQAQKAGTRLQELTTVTGPVLDAAGRVVGVAARVGPEKVERTYRAPVVIAADGVSARLALTLGIAKREDRPMGVAVRRYYESPRHDDDMLESWLELRDDAGNLLPGYGWVFGVGDGTSNVGLGILNTTKAWQDTDYKKLLAQWTGGMPEQWQYDEEHAVGPVRGGALPMGFSRTPHCTRGVLLVGDAGGAVNPFNGEGIAYAMESGLLAAEAAAQALARPAGPAREKALQGYASAMKDAYGGYYTLGRWFVQLIGHPQVMQVATQHGLPRPLLMKFTLKLLANLTDPRGGDALDRVVNGLVRMAPSA
ncbi:MAG TPA: geranylgeranyl reductase family protein, partial [Mycobacteriales bacterium]|nr:geranylgeranyl reductase family protein [Mycobacteriales bacterium]